MNLAKSLSFLAMFAGAGLMAQTPGQPDTSFMKDIPASRQHAPIRIKEAHMDGTATSTNWSGYAVTASTNAVSSATASWVVPTSDCRGSGPSTGYAAFWVGIDGYSSSSVEQTGTDSDCSDGSPVYYAWYEFYPQPSYEVTSVTVSPGDVISASVTYSGSEFTVKLTNGRTGKTFSRTAKVSAAKRSSAEWIAEAPSSGSGVLPLADFGTVFFGSDSTGITGTNDATISGSTKPIGGFPSSSIEAIIMESSGGSTEAVPSALSSDKTSFSVQWY